MIHAPMLDVVASAPLRRFLAEQVDAALADVAPNLRETVEGVLGDLGLWLARRPFGDWTFTAETAAKGLGGAWMAPEVSAVLEICTEPGFFASLDDGYLCPTQPEALLWLAARRTITTEDTPGNMNERLRGPLTDVFAMVVAEQADPDRGRGLAALIAEGDGPFEGLLELSARLAASAGAWGGALDIELRSTLLARSLDWIAPFAPASHRQTGCALLAAELSGRHRGAQSFADELKPALEERLGLLLRQLDDPALEDHQSALVDALDATLTPLVAPRLDDEAKLLPLLVRLGPYATRLGHVVGSLCPPGAQTDELLVRLSSQAQRRGAADAMAILGAISDPSAVPAGLFHDALRAAIREPSNETVAVQAHAACAALASWDDLSELTTHLLGRVVLAPLEPELRIRAALAIARHPRRMEESAKVLCRTLDTQLDDLNPFLLSGVVGAALQLGSPNPDLPELALDLIASDIPGALLSPALIYGLRLRPTLVDPLIAFMESVSSQAHAPFLEALQELGSAGPADHRLGPFLPVPPLTSAVRVGLTSALLPIIEAEDEPATAGPAAVLAGWLCRGHETLADLLFDLRSRSMDPELSSWLNVALGTCGVAAPAVQAQLARDAAQGEAELAASAGQGLAVLFDVAEQMDEEALDPQVPGIRQRADFEEEGPCLREALYALSTLPAGS